jgi:hypothetical protein
MNHSVSKLPESESSWETSSTSFDLMKSRGNPAGEAAVRAAVESPRTSQGSRRAPRRRNPAVDAEAATATRIKRRTRVLLWAEPRPPAAAAAADDGASPWPDGGEGGGGSGIRSNGPDLENPIVYGALFFSTVGGASRRLRASPATGQKKVRNLDFGTGQEKIGV